MKSLETAKTCSLWAWAADMAILLGFWLSLVFSPIGNFFTLVQLEEKCNLQKLSNTMRRTEEGGGRISNNSTTHKIEIENTIIKKCVPRKLNWRNLYTHNFSFIESQCFFYIFLFRGKFKSAAFRLWWSTKKNSLWTTTKFTMTSHVLSCDQTIKSTH